MILYKGKIYDNSYQTSLIAQLKDDMYKTLSNGNRLDYIKVINACDVLYTRVKNHYYDDIVLPLLDSLNMPYSFLDNYAKCFSKEGLNKKIENELSDLIEGEKNLDSENTRAYRPLGILFHIPAGNMDLLPAYSVVEGLLVGNINILKLPSGDNGMSVKLLSELIEIEPELKDYIYVFDVPSVETETIKQLSDMSDGTVIWGGDQVATEARKFVSIHSSLIIWGHKISFSYVDENVRDDELVSLAKSICMTNQLLCSSSQGIYVDTDNEEELHEIGSRFSKILAQVSKEMNTLSISNKARNTMHIYTELVEGNKERIYYDNCTSVIIDNDSTLKLSSMYQNVWIKPLKRENIIDVLKPNKNILQTVSVNEDIYDRDDVFSKLLTSGVVRITKLGDNSRMIPGEAHDGEYPLRRYIRIVEKYK